MSLKDIVTLFKNHQIQYGLNGDSNLEELYKWELVSKQNGHPDPYAADFSTTSYITCFKRSFHSISLTLITITKKRMYLTLSCLCSLTC